MTKELQTTSNLPEIAPPVVDLQDFIKDQIREGFKGIMKEAFDEWLGDKRAKEIRDERAELKRQAKFREDMARWKAKFDARTEEENHNPTISFTEAAKIIGCDRQTLVRYAKAGKIQAEHDGNMGWYIKTNYAKSLKDLGIIKARPNKPRETNGYATANELKKMGLIPLGRVTLDTHRKQGRIRYKTKRINGQEAFLYEINHIKELLGNPPPWLQKSLKWSKACKEELTREECAHSWVKPYRGGGSMFSSTK
jgi:hypothetical protein